MKSFVATSLLCLGFADSAFAWNYKQAGADWGSEAEVCESGKSQTPINLPIDGSGDNHSRSKEAADMTWSTNYDNLYRDKVVQVGESAYPKTYQMDLPNGGEMTFTDKDGNVSLWELQQFHHHTPSEHRYDGEQRPLELHFVHYSKDGTTISSDSLAVLSISFVESEDDAPNEWLANFVSNGAVKLNTSISYTGFNAWINGLNTGNFYNYMGSLTTPTCGEIVNWVVVQEAQPASKAQIAAFEAMLNDEYYLDGNAREQQKLNSRTIYMKTRPSFATQVGLSLAAAAGIALNLAL